MAMAQALPEIFTVTGKQRSSLTFAALAAFAALTYMSSGQALAQPPSGDVPAATAPGTTSSPDSSAATSPSTPSSSPTSSSPSSPSTSGDPTSPSAGAIAGTPSSTQTSSQPAPDTAAQPTERPSDYVPDHAIHPQVRVPSGQGRRGFVVAASFGVRPYFAQVDVDGVVSTQMVNALQGGLSLGYKTGRVVITLGLDLGSIDIRDTFTYRTTATFLFVPGLQVALVRSRDQRVELIGSLRLGAGSTMSTDATSTSKPPALVMYDLGPAVRYWAHRQFAVQFFAGYGGEYQIVSGGAGNTSKGRHGLAAAIGTIGIF
jgi:hypothetical protein